MNLRAQLAEALAIFDQCDAKAALIGGLALAAHRVVRATTDIDFLLDASSYREVRNALVAAGFECLHENVDAANFARGSERLDLILAHRPRAREMLDQAEDRTIYGRNLRVVAVESLIALKLQALANNPRRTQDIEDIRSLLRSHSATLDRHKIRTYFALFQMDALYEQLASE